MNNTKEDRGKFEGNFEESVNMVLFFFGFVFLSVLVIFCHIFSFKCCVHSIFSLLISISNKEYVNS